MDPMTRSTNGFCQGDRGAERTSSMSSAFPRRRNSSLYTPAIAKEISRCRAPRKCLDDLLGRPCGGRGVGHVEVKHASAIESEHDKHVQQAKACRGHGEEVDRC